MKRVSKSVLNASTLDILNVIRENAGYEYQNTVPKVTKATDIPAVGQIRHSSQQEQAQPMFLHSLED